MISDNALNKAGEMAEKLRDYSEEKDGEPLIDDGAELIDTLVQAILEERDARRGMVARLKTYVSAIGEGGS